MRTTGSNGCLLRRNPMSCKWSFEPHGLTLFVIPSLSVHDAMNIALSDQLPMRAVRSNDQRKVPSLEYSNPVPRFSVTGGQADISIPSPHYPPRVGKHHLRWKPQPRK